MRAQTPNRKVAASRAALMLQGRLVPSQRPSTTGPATPKQAAPLRRRSPARNSVRMAAGPGYAPPEKFRSPPPAPPDPRPGPAEAGGADATTLAGEELRKDGGRPGIRPAGKLPLPHQG